MSDKNIYRKIHYRIDVGLNRANQVVQTEIPELSQFDNKSGLLVFDFYNEGRRVPLENTRILVNFLLPNGKAVADELTTINLLKSRASYVTPNGLLQVDGLVSGNITLYKEDSQITAPVKFNFMVVDAINTDDIVGHEGYPILMKLIADVDKAIDKVNQWDEHYQMNYHNHDIKFKQKYDSVSSEFDTMTQNFTNRMDSKFNEVQSAFNNKSTTIDNQFNTQYNFITRRFDEKYQEIDDAFHGADVDEMFAEKFEGLEEEYAETYADMKKTVREVYNTTLKYRYID